jgi:signal peptidase I
MSIFLLLSFPAVAYSSFLFPGGKITPASIQGKNSFSVPGSVMLPTLRKNQMIYFLPGKVKQGDVVLYKSGKHIYAGRVVGVPGDAVKVFGNKLYINGDFVKQHYVGKYIYHIHDKGKIISIPVSEYSQQLGDVKFKVVEFNTPESRMKFGPTIVSKKHYYIMADNRDDARDSRFKGVVGGKDIFGVAHPVTISSDDLWHLYRYNEVMFDKNLVGKYIYVYGTIGTIKIYHNKQLEITFKSNGIDNGVDCIARDTSSAYGLGRNQNILVGGRIVNMGGFHVNKIGLSYCTIKKVLP